MTAPHIDFSEFREATGGGRRHAAQTIGRAACDSGFFYLTSSGLTPERVADMLEASRGFFGQPEASKLERRWDGKMPVMGYVPRERESLDESRPPDLKEAFNVPPPADDLDAAVLGRIWPHANDPFRPQAEDFAARCFALAQEVLAALALYFDLPEDWFSRGHRPQDQTLRLLHYFPAGDNRAARQLGAGDHSDHGTLTLLMQDETGGLEFLDRDDRWQPLPPDPDAVLVNAGDLLGRWTGGAVRSAPHRVLATDRHRYSLAYFLIPSMEVVLSCPATASLAATPEVPAPLTAEEFLLLRSLRRTERFYRYQAGARQAAQEPPEGLAAMRNLVATRLGLDAAGLDRRLSEFGHVDYRHASEG